MFTIYHSNQLDMLKTLTIKLISGKPLHDPLQPEVILVQSNGMEQWMQIELAAYFGISANIYFSLPACFIWQMFTRVLPYVPDESAFTKSAMTWRLMKLLPHIRQKINFTAIRKYLCDDDDKRKLFQFSAQIADLFDQYLVYRPNWLEKWQRSETIDELSKAQHWQALLWRELTVETERAGQPLWHFANLYQLFIQTLMKSRARPPGLPDRVFICGISALPPTYLQVLQALGRHIDIHMLFTNPCRYYWGDICNNTFLAQLLNRSCQYNQYYHQYTEQALLRRLEKTNALLNILDEQQTGNPLLISWGKQGRDNLYLLTQMDDIAEIDAFIEPADNNVLSIVQRDILLFENHAVISMDDKILTKKSSKRLLQLDDRSISIHICHSPQREVEVLHDNLLAMIAEDPTLCPHEIIVMAADIDYYTPAIQAVFSNTNKDNCLPFSISDRRVRNLHPVLTTFINLLELPYSRFTAEQVLALLEVPALAARFSINEQGLQLLRLWVTESGIRWGLDDDTLRKFMLPTTGQYTWQFGLTRMLLGYAMDSESGNWQDILPYDGSSGLMAGLVGQLAELLMRLRYWRNRLTKPRTLNAWISCAREIIDDFFNPDDEAKLALTILENQWQQILLYGLQVEYDQPVLVSLLQNELISRLNQELINHSFLTGNINFCTLMPMRSIPFKVVCLLGMNDGVYPRVQSMSEFNLMAHHPQRGDRSQRDDDYYLFLEALLSAQHRFYISFIGRAIQDNTPRYPSVLVNELSDYIVQSFHLPGDENIDDKSRADRVRAHLWQWHSRMPFAPENFLPGGKFQSFAKEWLLAAGTEGNPQPNFIVPLTAPTYEVLSLDELICFYRHPVRAWFIQRLAISFQQTSFELEDYEPFVIDNLTSYQLNNQLVNILIDKKSTDQLFHQARATGLLPYGSFGKLYWAKQCQDMTALSKHIQMWQLPKTYNVEIFLTLDKVILSGWITQVQENGLLRWRPSTLSAIDGLLLWIEHLSYCAMGGKGESRMFGTHGEWHFAPLSACRAKEFLFMLVSGYYQGMSSPLLLLPHTGSTWLNQCYDPVTKSINWNERRQKQARNKLILAWQGNSYISGEKNDPYLQRLIYQLEDKHIENIISNAERYFLPPFMFNLTHSYLEKYEKKG